MNHTPPIFIKQGENSVAYFTTSNPKKLVVFVHGFNGSATDTWNEFPSLIKRNSDYAHSDVIFYGYKSLKGQINNNAIKFYTLLKLILDSDKLRFGFTKNNLGENFAYEKIVIVAHSLGSIVVRRALLNAKTENKAWLECTKMILFAPAHRGARIQNPIIETLPVFGKILAGLGLIAIPVLEDLRPESQTIKNLISDTDNLLAKGIGSFTIAHKVVWADKDIIVHNERFCQDPVAELIEEKSHTKVCKPKNPEFLNPFKIVTEAL